MVDLIVLCCVAVVATIVPREAKLAMWLVGAVILGCYEFGYPLTVTFTPVTTPITLGYPEWQGRALVIGGALVYVFSYMIRYVPPSAHHRLVYRSFSRTILLTSLILVGSIVPRFITAIGGPDLGAWSRWCDLALCALAPIAIALHFGLARALERIGYVEGPMW